MKEATGELNVTLVIIVAISAMAAFFYFVMWPSIRNNVDANTKCAQAICENCPSKNCTAVNCHLKGSSNTFKCVWKG